VHYSQTHCALNTTLCTPPACSPCSSPR
jgi:hypothetical protein